MDKRKIWADLLKPQKSMEVLWNLLVTQLILQYDFKKLEFKWNDFLFTILLQEFIDCEIKTAIQCM